MEETVLLSDDTGIFKDEIYRICNGYEYQYDDSVPSERVPVLWRVSRGDSIRQYEASGDQAVVETGGFHFEPAV